jgi:subtilase family serine protease
MDVTVDGEGRTLVGFADGCSAACAAPGGAQNFDALATIARQTAGPRLFAAFDAQPDLTVAAPTATRNGKTTTFSVVVTNQGGAAAIGVTVSFGCGSKTYATSQPITLAPGASATMTATSTSLPSGKKKLTAVVDPSNTVAESDEGNNRSSGTVST